MLQGACLPAVQRGMPLRCLAALNILNARMDQPERTSSAIIEPIGRRLRILRQRCGLSIRQLAAKAGVTAGMISCIERDRNSPSIATMQKILSALGSDLAGFFAQERERCDGPVYGREGMRLISDRQRSYTILFPKRDDIPVEMLDEQYLPSAAGVEFETLPCDVAGYVISGGFVLEIAPKAKHVLRAGDAFHVPKGVKHRGYASREGPARVVTVFSPANY